MSVADLHFITGIGKGLGGSSLLAAQFHRLGTQGHGPVPSGVRFSSRGWVVLDLTCASQPSKRTWYFVVNGFRALPQTPGRRADQSAVGELPVDAAGSWVAVRSR